MSKISVVLNCYKRPHVLPIQINALKKQTIQPVEILIWQNKGNLKDFEPIDEKIQKEYPTVISNLNFGVWSRFSYALNSIGDYICLIDDDTIPGEKWLENCINTYSNKRGVLGTIGIIFKNLSYKKLTYTRYGWDGPNNEIKQVDIVCQNWFFDREVLGAYWREAHVPIHNLSGEDVHLSYVAQKYLNLNTYVPPHPIEDKSLWGSNPETAWLYGVDSVAISEQYQNSHFGKNLEFFKNKGFKFLNI